MARTLLKRLATLVAAAVLFTQLAVAAHACAGFGPSGAADTVAATDAAPMPDCHELLGTADPASSNLCAEHCKQGQSDRATTAVAVPPVLLTALYEAPTVAEPVHHRSPAGAWLSALVAASPPHAIAHCVLRI